LFGGHSHNDTQDVIMHVISIAGSHPTSLCFLFVLVWLWLCVLFAWFLLFLLCMCNDLAEAMKALDGKKVPAVMHLVWEAVGPAGIRTKPTLSLETL